MDPPSNIEKKTFYYSLVLLIHVTVMYFLGNHLIQVLERPLFHVIFDKKGALILKI